MLTGPVPQETDNPDLRDRAYVYWRLLGDPDTARQVVLAQKPVIADTGGSMEPSLLATLLANLSSLASVYHKPPEVCAPAGCLIDHSSLASVRSMRPVMHLSFHLSTHQFAASCWVWSSAFGALSSLAYHKPPEVCAPALGGLLLLKSCCWSAVGQPCLCLLHAP